MTARPGVSLFVGLLCLTISACGAAAPVSQPSTSPSDAGSPTAAAASPTPTPMVGHFALLMDLRFHAPTYDLALVSPDAKVAARVTARNRSILTTFSRYPLSLYPARSALDRVYFLDGDTTLRWLKPDGTSAVVRELPGGPLIESAFAVSPDNQKIAVAVYDYSTEPPAFQLFVEDLSGGHRLNLPHPGYAYGSPFGWWQGSVMVGETDPHSCNACSYYPLGGAGVPVHFLDGSTGRETGRLCGIPINGAALCSNPDHSVYVQTLAGQKTPEPQQVRRPASERGALTGRPYRRQP